MEGMGRKRSGVHKENHVVDGEESRGGGDVGDSDVWHGVKKRRRRRRKRLYDGQRR
jgi:hypothetical protein